MSRRRTQVQRTFEEEHASGAHFRSRMRDEFSHVRLAYVPDGMTFVCRPLDRCIMRSWKAAARATFAKYGASHITEDPFEPLELGTSMGVSKPLVGAWAKAANDHVFSKTNLCAALEEEVHAELVEDAPSLAPMAEDAVVDSDDVRDYGGG